MARGIYRSSDGWVRVDYGKHNISIPRGQYDAKGYQPPYEELPSEEAYRASQEKGAGDAAQS